MFLVRQILVLLMALAAFPAFCQSFTFATPSGWKLEWTPDSRNQSGAPNAHFSSDGDDITASVSIVQGKDVSGLNAEQLRGVLIAMAEDSFPNSREGQANIKQFGTGNSGMYARLTDKDSKTRFKYVTYAILRKGKDLSLGTMTSNDDDGALLPKFFSVFESLAVNADQSMTSDAAGSKPTAKVMPEATESDVVWGAIASETNMTDNDPVHAFGQGDTRAEAEKDALTACRDEGAKRCVVRVAYKQCGAFAVSGSGKSWGWGVGPTKRAAEKFAIGGCKGVACDIVASDCN